MKNLCKNCGKEFNGKVNQKCCSRKCSNELKFPKVITKCDYCGKKIEKRPYEIERSKHHYCSSECRSKHQKLTLKGESNPNFKKANIDVKCSNCGKKINILKCTIKNSDGTTKKNFYCSQICKAEYQKKILKKESNPNFKGGDINCSCDNCGKEINVKRHRYKIHKYHYCSQDCKAKHQQVILVGKNNPFYKLDLSEEDRVKLRCIDGYNTWRRLVYERDNYTCQCCSNDKGGNLEAHHLDGYNWCKEKRTNVDNGVTLCEICHNKFHNLYGFGDNKKEQFEEFMKNNKNQAS